MPRLKASKKASVSCFARPAPCQADAMLHNPVESPHLPAQSFSLCESAAGQLLINARSLYIVLPLGPDAGASCVFAPCFARSSAAIVASAYTSANRLYHRIRLLSSRRRAASWLRDGSECSDLDAPQTHTPKAAVGLKTPAHRT